MPDDGGLHQIEGDRRHDQGDAIERRRDGGEVVLAHPGGGERYGREPEQQVQVRPQDRPIHIVHQLEEVVVVVPVDGQVDEAQHVAGEHGPQRDEILQPRAMRRLHLQHHDGDQDRDNAVRESRQSFATHVAPVRP